MKLVVEERVVSAPSATIKITVATVPASIQATIARGLDEGPTALARMYPPPQHPQKDEKK